MRKGIERQGVFYPFKRIHIPFLTLKYIVSTISSILKNASSKVEAAHFRRALRRGISSFLPVILAASTLSVLGIPATNALSIGDVTYTEKTTAANASFDRNCPAGYAITKFLTKISDNFMTQTGVGCLELNASGTSVVDVATSDLGWYGNADPAGARATTQCQSTPTNRAVVGIRVYRANTAGNPFAAGVQLRCGVLPDSSSRAWEGTILGGSGTLSSVDIECPEGKFAVGFYGYSGSILDGLGLKCGTITGASQTITFANPGTKVFGSGNFSVAPTSTSALNIAVTSATDGVCTVSGTTVSLVSTGTCTLNANQASNTNYAAATQVQQSFTVSSAAALTPTFGTPTPTADGFTVPITNHSGSYTWAGTATASGSVSIDGSGLVTVSGVAVGTSSTATITTSRTNYVGGTATVSATSYSSCAPTSSVSGGYTYVTFSSETTCSWTTPTGVTAVEVTVVGGGGGGGFGSNGGGGGAGEVLVTGSSASLSGTTVANTSTIATTPGTKTVVKVGGGGTSGAPTGSTESNAYTAYSNNSGSTSFGGNGSASSFGSVSATGGGGGGGGGTAGTTLRVNGAQGGSGGGGAIGGTGGAVGSNTTPSGWKSFKSAGSDGAYGGGGGAGSAGSTTRGGSGVTVFGTRVAGGGAGWGYLGSENSLTDTVLGGNGRLGTGTWPYAGTAPNYTSAGTPATGTGGGAGAPGGSGVVIVKYMNTSAAAPAIGTQPAGTTKTAFQSASFSVAATASDSGALTYQWQKASGSPATWSDISGATSSTYSIASVTVSDAGDYRVVVTNTYNSATAVTNSNSATLAVNAAVLATPTDPTVTATFDTLNSISVSWTAVTNATQYKVFLYKSADDVKQSEAIVPTGTTYVFDSAGVGEIANYNTWKVSVQALGEGNYTSGSESGKVTVTKNSAYTITYSYNGATADSSTATSQFITNGTGITLPAPTRTGYTFAGWFEASALSGSAVTSPYSPSETRTVYAKWTANTYTVTYNYNGATAESSTATSSFTTGGTTITLPTPTKSGYTFAGWYSDSGLTSSIGAGGASYSPTGATTSLTVYAKWTANTYTVTYNYNGATADSATATSSFTTGGSTITLPTPTKTGYTFAGWYSDSGLTSSIGAGGASYSPTGATTSLTVYAKWTANTYTVTYNYNSATGGNSTATSSYTTGGTTITLPTPTKSGYTFAGWYSDSGLTSSIGSAGASYSPTGATTSLTVYAKWTANTDNAITYNNYSATTSQSGGSTTYTTGSPVFTIPTTPPQKTGYTFSGWYTASSGGVQVTDGSYTPASPYGAITLHAQWAANTYTVTYNYNGATADSATATSSFTTGGTAITLPTPTKSGYTFAGWHSDSGLTSSIGAGGASYSPTGATTSLTVYAKWTANTYTVTYTYNGATGGNSTTTSSFTTGGTVITLPTPTKTGYTFAGWYSDSGLTSSIGSAGASYSPTGATTTLSAYAKWTANSLTVTFNSNGGSDVSNGSVDVGAQLTATTDPTRSGYYFFGWSTTNGGAKITSFPYTHNQTSNFTLYAIWTIDVYSNNLRVNLDASNRNSLASGSPSTWNSIAPGTSFSSIGYRGTFSPSSTPGKLDTAVDSYVSFGHQSAAEIAGDITVEAWIKLPANYVISSTSQEVANHYFEHATGSKNVASMDWYLRIANGRLVLFTSDTNGAESAVQSDAVITSSFADKWILIGFTQRASDGKVQFYFNGAPNRSLQNGNPRRGSTTARLLIGNGNSTFLGSISKFRMYAEALTADQIKSNFNLEAATFSRLQLRTLTIDSGSFGSSYTTTATPPTLTATRSVGTGDISFTSNNSSICTVNSSTGVVAFVTSGTCTIQASVAADSTYEVATSAAINMTVTATTRTLAIDSGSYTSTYTMVATPPTITSTASAGTGAKSYTSSTASVCTVNSSSGLVAFVAAGTCTISSSIAADTTYASAISSSVSFTLSAATQTVTWAPTTSLLATASPVTPSTSATALGSATISYAVTSAGATGCTVNSSTGVLTFTSSGNCEVTATAAATTNYATASKAVTFAISSATQSITRTSTSPTSPVKSETYTPTATASSSLTVAITIASGSSSICSISAGVVTFNAAGSCVIQYDQSGNGIYAAATQVTETLTIGKATPTFSTWSNISKTFGDATFSPTAPTVTGSISGSFAYSSATTSVISISGTTFTVAGGGTSVITATFTPTDSTNYNSATTTMTVTVSAATQTITWAPTTSILTTASPATPSALATALGSATISYAVTSAGTTGCTVNSSTGVLTFTTSGSCEVTSTAASTTNYASATKVVTFVISLATRTLAIDSGSYTSTYTMVATPPTLTATASTGTGSKTFTSATTSICTVNSSSGLVAFVAPGTCTISASIAADSTYTSATSSSISFTVSLAAALKPAFGTPTSTADGFTVSITNYSASYTWAGTATESGTVTVNGSGLVTVTGVAAGTPSRATITTARTGYAGGSESVTATSIVVYTITYAAGTGGSGSAPATPRLVSDGTTFTTPANTFVKNGFTFAGWNDGTATYLASVTYPATGTVSGNVTLTATWTGNICSPTSATSGGYTRYTFTSTTTCFWDVPVGVSAVDVLAVAGGAGGGYAWDNTGAGGGAGGQVISTSTTLSGTVTVSVGSGGAGGTTSSRRGSAGTDTSIGSITALAGTGGCSARSSCSVTSQATALIGANGGAGGSGGASGKGGGGSNTTALAPTTTTGGTGTASNYSGTSVTYGAGGAGGAPQAFGSNIVGVAGGVNTGKGGGGASAKNSSGDVNGGAGGSGLIIVRVANANTVVFDANTGSGTMSDQSITSGIATALTSNSLTKTGHSFAGWNTNSDGVSGTSYTNGETVTITSGMTLYAKWTLNALAVTFNANNGTGTMSNQSVNYGVATNLSANLFTRANYVFYRWATAANGSGSTYNNLAAITLTVGTTLYAQWTANTYVVTYNYDSATAGSSTASASFTTGGSEIVLPTPTKTGYTFAGWYSDAALTSSIGSAGAGYSPTGTTLSLNAYAKWAAINYPFTYDGNSADTGAVPTESSKQITQTVTVKANTGSLIRVGYTFNGWNTASNGTGTNYLSGSLFTVGSSDVTLYAKWSANSYTVTYNSNGGTGSAQRSSNNVATDSYTTGGSAIALPGVGSLERSGYTFGGWNTSAAGNGTNRLEADSYTTASDVTFYATWNAVTYSITYNGNTSDGGSAPTTGGYTTGQASPYVVLANSFTKTSSIFGGWNTNSGGTGTNYSPGASITTLANVTLYAVWIPQYTLHYAINGGTVTSGSLPGDTLYTTGTSVGPVFSSLSRTGYTFDGWTNGATTIAPGGNFTILADSVLTAKWTAINYTISYNSDGGSNAPAGTTKQIGQSYTVGSAGGKPGYNFTGWWNGSSLIGADAVIVMGSSNVTYTAQWAAKVYRIAYDWNGGRGTAVSDVSYTFGTPAISLPLVGDRVKDGYTFAGWSEGLSGSLLNATYIPSQSRTLYALWDIGNFTVTYDAGRGTVTNSSVAVLNGGSTTLPLPTRSNFVFTGWYTASTGGTSVGSNGSSFAPSASQTVFARWTQSSLYGITDSLTRIGSVVTSDNVSNTFSGANSNSSVAVSVPANAFAAGTTINFDLVGNSSRAVGVLPNVNYLISIAVSWLTGDETVPDTAAGKPISVTISNATIKAGASAYAIINNVSTLLGTATQDGTITVSITSDPEIVVAATKPDAPVSVSAASNGNQQSVISWNAPSSNGGAAITGYTVTANTGATCTTVSTSCTISSLSNGTTYSFTVTATNSVGTSVASSSASATTASLYSVTFNAKGGSAVSNGSFLTASTVSEPTAPTRTGYAFAGWSATDGGSIQIFPYAPGVTSNITMYARWDALDNAVTFNSKGGSAVADGVFPSGGTLSAPTAPTRAGYSFAGWSATDGGSAVTFPYSPGVVTDITLYAKWGTAGSGSSGGGSNAPSSGSNGATVVAPVVVTGDKAAKVLSVEITIPVKGSEAKPVSIKIDTASQKFIAEAKIVEGKLALKPETGFSGKKSVTVTITENGSNRVIQIPLTVLPEVVSKPVITPVSAFKSIIKWTKSPNANSYSIYLNGKKVCSTSSNSCSIPRILGPDSTLEIVSSGGDRTFSEKIVADFKQSAPVVVTRVFSATVTKAEISKVDAKALDKVIGLVKSQGFRTVVISNITTTKKTEALAASRILAIQKYITDKSGLAELNFEVIPAANRTYFNNIALKGQPPAPLNP